MITIEQFFEQEKLPNYRWQQFNQAIYQQLISDFDQLTTWSKDLRTKLKAAVAFSSLKFIKKLVSADGGTTKVLLERENGQKLEAVLMQHEDGRNSVCVSCMVGCPVGCKFCATGKMVFLGKLNAQEIVDQVLYFARLLQSGNQQITNVVFMGMGEPLLNLDNVWQAIQTLTDEKKFALGKRRVTLSTAGFVREFRQIVKLGFRGRVAISLHAPNQALREQLMPVAKTYILDELFQAMDEYVRLTNKRITYEYILIENFNDSSEHAQQLAKLLKNRLAHVNLIPYNPVAGESFARPSKNRIHHFAQILDQAGIAYSIRVTMGDDIKAACGQLAGQS